MSFLFQNVVIMPKFSKIAVCFLWGFDRALTLEKRDPQFPAKQNSEISPSSERATLWGLLNPESNPLGEATLPTMAGERRVGAVTRTGIARGCRALGVRCFPTAGNNGRKRSVIWANAFCTVTCPSKWQAGTRAPVKPILMTLSLKVLCLEQKQIFPQILSGYTCSLIKFNPGSKLRK